MVKTLKPAVVRNLMDHDELLKLFQDYVAQGAEDSTPSKPFRPLSFDEWYVREYMPNIDTLTQEVVFFHKSYAAGYHTNQIKCRIPAGIVSDLGGIFDSEALCRMAQKLALIENKAETYISFGEKYVYRWSEH